MAIEALVFGDDKRLLDGKRDLIQLDEGAPLESELGDESPVGGVQFGGLARRVIVESVDGRALPPSTHEGPGAVTETQSERRAEGEQ